MIRILTLLMALLFIQPSWAETNLDPLLNKVTFQLRAEQWVSTSSAVVTVGMNVASTDHDIGKVQNDVMAKLKQLSDQGIWHIISFDRQEDRSGLEAIQILAEARLPQTALANLRSKAKQISKPGQTLTIDSVIFTPSDAELRLANQNLRNDIYTQIISEIDALNKKYPDHKFYMHQINFLNAAPVLMMAKAMNAAASSPPMMVGSKQEMHASVVIASWPEQLTPKATRTVI